ncbi:uncharacterized protein LOC132708630 [Cylas formicarius]|uniref:uncharacterized protein LOC132708630 n=1 Tax=Cylas formicarius TaxID=197179 RepID=UPI0029585D38|nr:uncharacterized protein LOC132708630 [Cylas formicarius]
METEQNQLIEFLEVLIKRCNGKLSHTVYRKPIHTDRYLHASSNHHPSQKRGIITTLTERARRICDPQHLEAELDDLKEACQSNGYRISDIDKSMRPRTASRQDPGEQLTFASAYLQTLRSAKDKRDLLSAAGVYRIPCTCGKVYVGTTKRSVATRIKEHQRSCRLGQTDKLAVAEHALSEGDHNILFGEARLLAPTSGYHARLVREAIEIHKHTNNFNRKVETLQLKQIWNPILRNTRTAPEEIPLNDGH